MAQKKQASKIGSGVEQNVAEYDREILLNEREGDEGGILLSAVGENCVPVNALAVLALQGGCEKGMPKIGRYARPSDEILGRAGFRLLCLSGCNPWLIEAVHLRLPREDRNRCLVHRTLRHGSRVMVRK